MKSPALRAVALAAVLAVSGVSPAVAAGPGSQASTFKTGSGLSSQSPPTAALAAVQQQGTGATLLAGYFTAYRGDAAPGIVLLDRRGAMVPSFDPGTGPEGTITTMLPLPSGQTMIGGNFVSYDGTPAGNVARINADGTIDRTFQGKANGEVTDMALAPDGDVVIVGSFAMYGRTRTPSGVVRLTATGRLDRSFRAATITQGNGGGVESVLVERNGKVVVGGAFTAVGEQPRSGIARLTITGALDTGFDPGTGLAGADGIPVLVSQLREYRGGYLVAGGFSSFNGESSPNLVLVDRRGQADTRFRVGAGFDGQVNSVAVQPDKRLIAVGNFTTYATAGAPGIVRLNKGGGMDASFQPGTGFAGSVSDALLQRSGRLIATGFFGRYDGVPSRGVVGIRTR